MRCNLDRSTNRGDDARRSPLSEKNVAVHVFVAIGPRRLMTVPFPSLTGKGRR